MKLLLQIILLFLLVIISVIFYNKYFKKNEIVEIKTSEIKKDKRKEPDPQNENNIIKNLNYNVDLIDDGNYEIKSDLSEVIIKDGSEIVLMKKVVAIFTDKNEKNYLFTQIMQNLTRQIMTHYLEKI